MIAIDTLVHNFLHRTGIIARFNANHLYGAACYRPGGCAHIIQVAERVDARSQSGLDDAKRCSNMVCRVRLMFDRLTLRSVAAN
jgi:hypothetical protein